MSHVLLNVALIGVFISISGIFAAAEMALISLREAQVKQLAHRGKRGQAIVSLTASPNRFLGAVQIGVTFSGFLSAAFGGATLADRLAPHLQGRGLSAGLASTLALVIVTLIISYFSIVFGELASKRLAMQRVEGFAMALAPLVNTVASIARPVIWLLGKSTDVAVRLLGGDPKASREQVTDEELRQMVVGSQTLGAEERHIVDEVFDAGERNLREVMVPRTEVDFVPGDMPAYKVIRLIQGAPRSRYPVTDGSSDRIVGFLHVRDLMDLDPVTRSAPVRQLARPVLYLPETVRVLRALTDMRRQRAHLAIVQDEYGGTSGIVTLEDLVEELIGEITDEYDQPKPGASQHTGRGEVDGLMPLDDFAERFGFELPDGPYDTVAGWFMAQQGRVPQLGDHVRVTLNSVTLLTGAPSDQPRTQLVDFRVTELDGRRAAWLAVQPVDTRVEAEDAEADDEARDAVVPDEEARDTGARPDEAEPAAQGGSGGTGATDPGGRAGS